MVDIKKDDDLARHSPTLADPRSPSPTLAPSFNLATLATLAYTLHLADSIQSKRKGDARIIMIWEEYRLICQLNIIIFFLVSELIQKQVKKFIYIQYFYSPYKFKGGFKKCCSSLWEKSQLLCEIKAIYERLLNSDIF